MDKELRMEEEGPRERGKQTDVEFGSDFLLKEIHRPFKKKTVEHKRQTER